MISYDQYECKIISYYELGMDKEGNWYMDSAHEHEFPEDENPPHGSNTDEEMENIRQGEPYGSDSGFKKLTDGK